MVKILRNMIKLNKINYYQFVNIFCQLKLYIKIKSVKTPFHQYFSLNGKFKQFVNIQTVKNLCYIVYLKHALTLWGMFSVKRKTYYSSYVAMLYVEINNKHTGKRVHNRYNGCALNNVYIQL